MNDRELLEAVADAVAYLIGREHTLACDRIRGTRMNIYDPDSATKCVCGQAEALARLAKARVSE